jgi:hypothetical protein
MRVTVFDHSFIRYWALRGKTYDEISARLGGKLTPHDVLMILLEMSNAEHQRKSERRHGDAGTRAADK